MKRREFMQMMIPVAGMPLLWPMWSFSKPARQLWRSNSPRNFPDDGRVLVLVQLAGGNDGLNTIVPYNNDIYYRERPQIAIPRNQVTAINGEFGFNGNLAALKPMLDSGNLGIVQSVGYPNPNRSHFRSTDIWLSGSDSEDIIETGWLGRYFDMVCPEGEPCGTFGPPAIQIGLTSSLALLGREQKGITLNDPRQFFNLVSRLRNDHNPDVHIQPTTPAEHELEFLRDTEAAAFQFAGEIIEAYDKQDNAVQYRPGFLADQLAIVSRLIAGGLSTRIYIVTLHGFDTHAGQNNPDVHPALLDELGVALSAFQQELELFGVADRVAGLCFSEFGRRVAQNASQGTDHGTAAPIFLFGNPVIGGLHGGAPDLSDLVEGDLKHHTDFRQIYASVMNQWLAGDADAVLGQHFETLPLFDAATSVEPGLTPALPSEFFLSDGFPNPFNPQTTVEYGLPEASDVRLDILNSVGQRVQILVNERKARGRHREVWQASSHASGIYFVRLQAGRFHETKQITLVK